MKIKIDENLPIDVVDMLSAAGHNVESVYSEGIEGCSDRQLITICKKEQRVLITLDYDFSNIMTYPPEMYKGVIILRVKEQSKIAVLNLLKRILPIISREQICGHLWIVEENKIRVRGPAAEN